MSSLKFKFKIVSSCVCMSLDTIYLWPADGGEKEEHVCEINCVKQGYCLFLSLSLSLKFKITSTHERCEYTQFIVFPMCESV